MKNCDKCGICCKLFLINLNELEYNSGLFKTVNMEFGVFEDFSEAENCGANILEQNMDGSCVYLSDGICNIHEIRPQVCREFFCGSGEARFKTMQESIDRTKGLASHSRS